MLDPSAYREQDLTTYTDDYFPIVIHIETLYPEEHKTDGGKARRQAQITYGTFGRDNRGELQFRFLKQFFLFRDHLFMLQDIFGNDAVVGAGGPLDDN